MRKAKSSPYGYMRINEGIPVNVLAQVVERVTGEYIKDDFGYLKDGRIDIKSQEHLVDPNRIDEIDTIERSQLDFTKLAEFLRSCLKTIFGITYNLKRDR